MCYFAKLSAIFVLLCLVTTGSSAIASPQDATAELIEKIAPAREHDFKVVPAGKSAVHEFEINNVTSKPLTIRSVHSSCGCATPLLTQRKIESGKSLKLPVQLDTLRFQGKRSASITVRFESEEIPEIQFQCLADIKSFSLSKEKIVLSPNSKSEKIELTRVGSSFWKIRSAQSTDPRVSVKLQRLGRKPKVVAFSLDCQWVSDDPIPNGKAFVRLETNDSKRRMIEIPVELKKSEEIETAPKTVRIETKGESQKVVIKTAEPTAVATIESNSELLKIAVSGGKNQGERKVHVIEVTSLTVGNSEEHKEDAVVRFKNGQSAVLQIVIQSKGDKP